jgi:hypothetical protein
MELVKANLMVLGQSVMVEYSWQPPTPDEHSSAVIYKVNGKDTDLNSENDFDRQLQAQADLHARALETKSRRRYNDNDYIWGNLGDEVE